VTETRINPAGQMESKMKIEIEVPAHVIANMMISAIESGDPVTTAARGGWCSAINLIAGGEARDVWYADAKLYEGDFLIEVVEVDDETTGHETRHAVRPDDMIIGLRRMATQFPHLFKEVLGDNTDASCADIFLQCIVFGEEKYA